MKKRYVILIYIICLAIHTPLNAQISGMRGKSGAIGIVANFRVLPYFVLADNEGYGYGHGRSLGIANTYLQIGYEKAFRRQQSWGVQMRHFSFESNTSSYINIPNSIQYEPAERTVAYNIIQIGAEYAYYGKRNWTLAPIGKSAGWGLHLNRMTYNIKHESNNLREVIGGVYLFPSISWRFNSCIPIASYLNLNLDIGLEIPLIFNFRKDLRDTPLWRNYEIEEFQEELIYNTIFSRLLRIGLSYSL